MMERSPFSQMNLTNCKDTKIGIPGRLKGISIGEKKRLAFACEVGRHIAKADQKRSALRLWRTRQFSSAMSRHRDWILSWHHRSISPLYGLVLEYMIQVVTALKKMASDGKTVISVIHQPSSQVFLMFDTWVEISMDTLLMVYTGCVWWRVERQRITGLYRTLPTSSPRITHSDHRN